MSKKTKVASYQTGGIVPSTLTNPIPNPMAATPLPNPMTDQIARARSLAQTGGRTPAGGLPLIGRHYDFANEEEIRTKTNQKRPIDYVPKRTPACDAAGPPIDTNLTQLTSDAQGRLETTEWMHSWWGHACGCGEEHEMPEVRRVNGRQV